MYTSLSYRIIFILVATLFFASCKQVVVTIESIPENTPKDQPLYIVGNFNNWDPGDEKYRMQLNNDSTFSISLPPGFGTLEYKFTRGDWTTVERNICGYAIDNHQIVIGETDTMTNSIESWNDLDPLNCPRLTLLVKNIPENTPKDEVIGVAGNFNSWAVDSVSFLQKDSTGNFSITIDRPPENEEIEFKFTRGDLASAESDEFGNVIPNRILRFGIFDTVEVKIEGWIDKPDKKGNRMVIIIDELPGNTPELSELYLVSSMNGWMPNDKNYIFQVNKQGKLFYPVPRKKNPLEFKITRGYWNTVEVDKFGYDIPNRTINPETTDTLHIEIDGWKDRSSYNDFEVTIVISHLPETTPKNESLFVTGNFNGWNPGRSKYRFKTDDLGRPVINLPRGKGFLEFKITRGSWKRVEVNEYGSDIVNRNFLFKDVDTVFVSITNWKDLPRFEIDDVTLVINKMPENTPKLDNIYLAPDFNNWDPGNPGQVFYYLPDGRPYITIPRRGRQTEYKITRGNWETVEVDMYGNPIDNRVLNYGFSDTVYIDVFMWRDFDGEY